LGGGGGGLLSEKGVDMATRKEGEIEGKLRVVKVKVKIRWEGE
jgi:hypothetical protein